MYSFCSLKKTNQQNLDGRDKTPVRFPILMAEMFNNQIKKFPYACWPICVLSFRDIPFHCNHQYKNVLRIHKMMHNFSGPGMGFVIILQGFLVGIVYLFLNRNITGCINQLHKQEALESVSRRSDNTRSKFHSYHLLAR